MSLRDQLMADLRDAMRDRDEVRKTTIRSVIAAMKQAETELDSSGARLVLNDDDILVLIARQARIREESITEFGKGGRADLVAKEQAELAILEAYLPKQLGREEIEAEARQVISEIGASSPGDLGKVMKPLMARMKGRADGRLVNEVVRELLAE